MLKVKKGDNIIVTSGKDRGRRSKVVRIMSDGKKIIAEGINERIRHVKPKRQGEKGQKVSVSTPFSISNIKLVCPKCNAATRIGFKVSQDSKMRFCKKCKQTFK